MAYRISNWQEYFENAASKKLKRLDWVAIPIKLDGSGYAFLVDHEDGAAYFGAWIAIVQIAAKQKVRGTLPDGIGGVCQTLARISRLPSEIFDEVLPRLVELGWVEEFETVAESADTLGESANAVAESADVVGDVGRKSVAQDRTGQDITEPEKNKTQTPVLFAPPMPKLTPIPVRSQDPPSQNFERWWKTWSAVKGTNHRPQAENAYFRLVTVKNEAEAHECTQSYLASLMGSGGYNPENFLEDQAIDEFRARWPPRAAFGAPAAPQLSRVDKLIAEEQARRAKAGGVRP